MEQAKFELLLNQVRNGQNAEQLFGSYHLTHKQFDQFETVMNREYMERICDIITEKDRVYGEMRKLIRVNEEI